MTREDHLLVILAEECAEVAKEAAKALRFGLDDCEPGTTETNRERIHKELRDLAETVSMLEDDGSLPVDGWRDGSIAKRQKVEEFLGYSRKAGRLE